MDEGEDRRSSAPLANGPPQVSPFWLEQHLGCVSRRTLGMEMAETSVPSKHGLPTRQY